ncbi:RNA-directed DNA polymerase, eukaryota, reverse transcriptase zinc-binding domain protein, partial [Tanacetum coccineum]
MTSTLKKLDRIMVNEEFIRVFGNAHGIFLPYLISDHSPSILIIPDGLQRKKSSFRFSNHVADKKDFLDIVRGVWMKEVKGCNMYKVVQKLKMLKGPLRKLSWKDGNIFEKVQEIKKTLEDVQCKLDADPFNSMLKGKAVQIGKEYVEAAEDELKLLHQKARVNWLKEGDKNSAYFHSILRTRRNKGRIDSICREDGSRVEDGQVSQQFVDHFNMFLGQSSNVTPLNDLEDYVQARLSDAEASAMITMVTDDEIKEAIFDIDSTKAAGPDGYSSCFFKKAWKCIGKDVCEAIRDFFTNGKLLGEINTTLIALVPKMDTPNKVSDFRPIACCNVLYKCISKILTNRIKDGLSKVISLNQSAFIPGRHIQDNILIAQELLKGYNRKNGAKRCAMKIDIQKAYDTVNWEFLRSYLTLVGFHETMINWIMVCISSASFSIYVNGELCGFFKGGRGLRQGDPISSYLFTLVMEIFNIIIIKNIDTDPSFKYHHGCKELKLTHMCFADDLMILCNGDSNSLKVIKKSLDEFSNASGLFPNLGKSTIFFGSINEDRKRELLEVLPFKFGKLPMKYLGVPLIAKKLSLSDCKSLIERVEKRVNCWRNKLLSYAGRIQLIASVLSSMQQYWASVYIIPISAVKELDKMFKRFLWNSGNSAQGKARVGWKMVYRPKCQGGLGIKPLKKWNETLLVSQLWKIIENKESLWVKWVNTVKLKGSSIWTIEGNQSDSWGWGQLLM